jgi:hypothetical protein
MFNIAPHKNKSSSTIDTHIEQQTLDHASDPAIYHKHRTGIRKSYSLQLI